MNDPIITTDYSRHVDVLRAHYGYFEVMRITSNRTVAMTDRGVVVTEDLMMQLDQADTDSREWVQVVAVYGDEDLLHRVVVVWNDRPVETILDHADTGAIRS